MFLKRLRNPSPENLSFAKLNLIFYPLPQGARECAKLVVLTFEVDLEFYLNLVV